MLTSREDTRGIDRAITIAVVFLVALTALQDGDSGSSPGLGLLRFEEFPPAGGP